MKHRAALALLALLTSFPACANNISKVSYVELTDSPTITIDWSKGDTQAVTLGGDRTLVFTNGEKGHRYALVLKQDATGSRKVTWPTAVHWPGEIQIPPTLTARVNKKDYLMFFYDGVNYDALAVSQNY